MLATQKHISKFNSQSFRSFLRGNISWYQIVVANTLHAYRQIRTYVNHKDCVNKKVETLFKLDRIVVAYFL